MSELDPSFDPNVDPALAEERAHRRRLARSTAVFGAATGVSRVLGLVREIIAAYTFGAAGKINAFTVAFQIPNLVRALVADTALSGAFVPVFSELLEKGERARAWRVASTIFWLVLLFTTALTAVFVLIAPLIVELFGTPGGDLDLAVGLSRLLFPIVILLGLSGIVVGILNAYDQFTVPALTPVAWNLVIILGLVLGVPAAGSQDAELYVYAGSIVLATLVQLLMPVPWLRGLDGRLRVAIDWRDPAVHRFFVLMLPVTLTLGLINVSTLIGTLFASRLIDPELAPRAIDLAFRLYMLPQGIFSVAVATVLFPTMSRLAARGDMAGFGRTVDTGIRQIGFLLIPAGIVSAVLASRSRGSSTSAASSPPTRRRWSRARSRRSPSASSSTAGCCCSTGRSTGSSRTGSRRSSRSGTSSSTCSSSSPSTVSASGDSRWPCRCRTSPARRPGGVDVAAGGWRRGGGDAQRARADHRRVGRRLGARRRRVVGDRRRARTLDGRADPLRRARPGPRDGCVSLGACRVRVRELGSLLALRRGA